MFYLFAGNDYYPEGGLNDYKGSFISLDLAIGRLNEITNDSRAARYSQDEIQWFHIVHIECGGWEIAARGYDSGVSKSSTHRLTDVTCDKDRGKRVMWMPITDDDEDADDYICPCCVPGSEGDDQWARSL